MNMVILLHLLIAAESGGSIGVRDFDLLDSALEGAFLALLNLINGVVILLQCKDIVLYLL